MTAIKIHPCNNAYLYTESKNKAGSKNNKIASVLNSSSGWNEKGEKSDWWLREFLHHNVDLRDKLSLLALRKIYKMDTYPKRIQMIFDVMGISCEKDKLPGVSVITCTNRLNNFEQVLANFWRQNYEPIELIIILNNNLMSVEKCRDKLRIHNNIKVFQLDEKYSLGTCLNFGVEKAGYGYIAKFDDDDYYAPYFLADLMTGFKYTNAGVVGKHTYYTWIEESRNLALRFPGNEHKYVTYLSGATMVIKREVFDKVVFPDQSPGEDTIFQSKCISRGIKLYSSDRFNYLCSRRFQGQHTWQINYNDYLDKCCIIPSGNDYIEHITV